MLKFLEKYKIIIFICIIAIVIFVISLIFEKYFLNIFSYIIAAFYASKKKSDKVENLMEKHEEYNIEIKKSKKNQNELKSKILCLNNKDSEINKKLNDIDYQKLNTKEIIEFISNY